MRKQRYLVYIIRCW